MDIRADHEQPGLEQAVPNPVDANTVNLSELRNARLTGAEQGEGDSAGLLTEPRMGGILARRSSLDSIEIYDKAFLRGVAGEVTR